MQAGFVSSHLRRRLLQVQHPVKVFLRSPGWSGVFVRVVIGASMFPSQNALVGSARDVGRKEMAKPPILFKASGSAWTEGLSLESGITVILGASPYQSSKGG